MIYSFDPVIDEKCRILILGTMPGVKSLERQQYYGHKQNAFWKIIFSLFGCEVPENYDDKKAFLLQKHIALWDVLKACDREGSSDSDIHNAVPNDLVSLLNRYPGIQVLFFNGEPANRLFNKFSAKAIQSFNIPQYRLPSTSPANTMKYEEKYQKWQVVLEKLQQNACISPDVRQHRGRQIVQWYRKSNRSLPWRETNDPYKIWISEIMLQQTQVETVIDYYLRFIGQFPDVRALADAPEDDVLLAWKGLGYYSRARNLQKAAKEIMEKFGGQFPKTLKDALSLSGVGPYTAGAVLSIAYNEPVPAVDGNVLRVISRLECLSGDIVLESVRRETGIIAREMMGRELPGDFNQGIMELGAMVCTPRNPRCPDCPVNDSCIANLTDTRQLYPVKGKAKAKNVQAYSVLLIFDQDKVLMEQRQQGQLLGGLWGFPMHEMDVPENQMVAETVDLAGLINKKYEICIDVTKYIGMVEHIFTHRVWNMHVYAAGLKPGLQTALSSGPLQWVQMDKLQKLAIPVAFQKVLELYSAHT